MPTGNLSKLFMWQKDSRCLIYPPDICSNIFSSDQGNAFLLMHLTWPTSSIWHSQFDTRTYWNSTILASRTPHFSFPFVFSFSSLLIPLTSEHQNALEICPRIFPLWTLILLVILFNLATLNTLCMQRLSNSDFQPDILQPASSVPLLGATAFLVSSSHLLPLQYSLSTKRGVTFLIGQRIPRVSLGSSFPPKP